jgi:hypothetical protein
VLHAMRERPTVGSSGLHGLTLTAAARLEKRSEATRFVFDHGAGPGRPESVHAIAWNERGCLDLVVNVSMWSYW